ncbi:hypothetical protein H7F33_09575 [Pedobacter sp. PAMC26386]|nr:hypothetical protein H7F33_09575 [Pedobacter sp. PAMC26386]
MIVILAIPYLVSVIRKVENHSIPFIKALNPFYSNEMNIAAQLKSSLSPIVKEMESQEMAKFIKLWTAKFEDGSFSAQDVILLNKKITEGREDQVNGILALHPEARLQFEELNEHLKNEASPVEQEAEVLA